MTDDEIKHGQILQQRIITLKKQIGALNEATDGDRRDANLVVKSSRDGWVYLTAISDELISTFCLLAKATLAEELKKTEAEYDAL